MLVVNVLICFGVVVIWGSWGLLMLMFCSCKFVLDNVILFRWFIVLYSGVIVMLILWVVVIFLELKVDNNF